MQDDEEEALLRSAAMQNATTILLARQRAEEEMLRAKQALERKTDELAHETRILELLNKTGTMLQAKLDLQSLVQAVTDTATEMSGAKFGACFYNVAEPIGDAYTLLALSGVPREAIEQFGPPRATPLFGPTFRGEGPIRCDDVAQDSRYGRTPPDWGMPAGHLPVRSYLAVPVLARSGEVLGGLFFGHPEAGVFSERTERLIVGVAAQAAAAIENARLFEAVQKAADERKHLLESERFARGEAERATSMKDEFLAMLSHELKTPLSSILGWSQLLRTGSMTGADMRRGLEVIERNARMQAQLVEDLLDMSRITSGKMRLDIRAIDPVAFMEAAVETVRPAADAKGLRLIKLLDPDTGTMSGDPDRLQQVVWNLLSNAVKFTERLGRVDVTLKRVESHVQITVADTGIGLASEIIPYVFDRFRQGDSSPRRTAQGLGLGLSLVKHLVELHGGTVHAASPGPGGGATFTVLLPLTPVVTGVERPQGAGSGPSLAPASEARRSELSGIKVLVVEDQIDGRELIERVLVDCGAEVRSAGTAEEALQLVEQDMPDVLVSDIGMPDMHGYELLRRIRALGHGKGGRLPAIAVTAFARSEDRTRALRAGFLAHIAKPMEPSELVATVASVVGRTEEAADE